jgi:hypothetical protein
MANAAYYLDRAEYCVAMAVKAPDQKLTSDWLKLADYWEEMATREAPAVMARIDNGLRAGP